MTLCAMAGMTTSPQVRESPETAKRQDSGLCWARADPAKVSAMTIAISGDSPFTWPPMASREHDTAVGRGLGRGAAGGRLFSAIPAQTKAPRLREGLSAGRA